MTQQSITPTWNLNDLYSGMDDPKIEEDFSAAEALVRELQDYRGKIATLNPSEMLTLIKSQEALALKSNRLGVYASLLSATNVEVPEVTRFEKQLDARMIQLGKETIFIEVEMAQLPEPKWQEFLNAPELNAYKKTLEDTYREAKHTLSEPEEKILAEKSQTSSQALLHLFSITTDTLMVDWNGEKKPLEEISPYLRDPDKAIRKQAVFAIHAALNTNSKTTPAVFNALIQDKEISDRLRNYDYPEERRFNSDDVEKDTVYALIEAVNKSSHLVERYYTLKKKILGEDTLHWWDRYAPLPKPKKEISPEEGKEMVLAAFEEFSPQVREIANGMFEKAHIDWFPSNKKRGGAFCQFGTPESYPYVLLNYTNDVNDVMTLAHELGHAVHDVLVKDTNVFFQMHPSLALAEIASTFSELLLFDKLLAGDLTKEDKIALLMGQIEDNFATVHRQIAMFQFEQAVHTKRRTDGELSKDQIDDLWHEIIKKPFGDSLVWTDEHKNFWMYIPHVFNWPFYVYSYAFAQLCTLAIYKTYKEKGSEMVENYLDILRRGGSMAPKDNLALAGFDVSTPDFWQNGLKMIEDYIAQLEAELA
ncbi:MAG TPA: M3 family oligoendopeptidase [Patescibacteria group bacterium]